MEILASIQMPWDKLIDASLFAFGAVFGAYYAGRVYKGVIDFERKRCERLEVLIDEMRKETSDALKGK
jgi:hypothetical protein